MKDLDRGQIYRFTLDSNPDLQQPIQRIDPLHRLDI